jgi:tetratricopeptide (TPR) repeat protein
MRTAAVVLGCVALACGTLPRAPLVASEPGLAFESASAESGLTEEPDPEDVHQEVARTQRLPTSAKSGNSLHKPLPAPRPADPQTNLLQALRDLWNPERPKQSLVELRQFRALIASERGPADLALVDTQIARARGVLGQHKRALKLLKRVRSTSELVRGYVLLERGRLAVQQNDTANARAWFEQALDHSDQQNLDAQAVEAMWELAALDNDPDSRETWFRRGLELAERSRDGAAQRWVGVLCVELGHRQIASSHPKNALDLFQRAQEVGLQLRDRELGWQATTGIGAALRQLEKVSAARDLLQEVIDERTAARVPDGIAYEEMGQCLLRLGYPKRARPHFVRAAQLLSSNPLVARREAPRIARLRVLSR